MNKEIIKGHLPVLVLGLLSERPMHGYAICHEIKDRGKDKLSLGEGTIYPLLYRLERQGYIRSRWQTSKGAKPRKVYQITKSGRSLIHAHQSDWLLLSNLFIDLMGKGWAAS